MEIYGTRGAGRGGGGVGRAKGGGAIWGRVEKHTSFPNADLPDEVDSGNS